MELFYEKSLQLWLVRQKTYGMRYSELTKNTSKSITWNLNVFSLVELIKMRRQNLIQKTSSNALKCAMRVQHQNSNQNGMECTEMGFKIISFSYIPKRNVMI